MYKKIGIIGGLSPESTVSYYLHITRSHFEKFGNYGYPEIIIYSVNLENYRKWRSENKWDFIIKDLASTAEKLQKAGADFGLIATNTMHQVFGDVQNETSLPLINLIDATGMYAKQKNLHTVGLLGTIYTMSEDFYKSGLKKNGLSVLVPSPDDQAAIYKIIVEELFQGKILDQSKHQYIDIIDKLKNKGAEGVVLGCTEIPLLIRQEDCSIPIIDTAKIHAESALLYAMNT